LRFFLAKRHSQQSGFTEAVEAPTSGIGGLRPEDEMIGELDVDGQCRLPQPAGLCEATDYGNWTTARRTHRA
jgi:hypothetical protein